DLLGDFWRFDVSDADPGNWRVGKMARLVDPNGDPQPVTTPPQIEVDASNGVDRWVFVGTGKLYDDSDLADHQVQTMYAFRDGTQTAPPAQACWRTVAARRCRWRAWPRRKARWVWKSSASTRRRARRSRTSGWRLR